MTSLFQLSTSLSSVAIFQHQQRTKFILSNSYVILESVPSTVSRRKSWWNKHMLHLGWSHRYIYFKIVSTIWLTVTRCQWIFSLTRREVLTFREHMGSPSGFGGVRVSNLFEFSVLSCVFVRGLSSSCVLCLVWQVLPRSLDCPFLIDPSVFSHVYK